MTANNFRCMRLIHLVGWLMIAIALCHGQNAAITKDQIISMSKAGLADDLIVAKIKSETTPPNLSTDDLIALKSAGVSDAVLRALLGSGPGPGSGSANRIVESPATGDPNDPMSPHDPGIYLLAAQRDGGRKLMQIERAGSGREKTANVWGHAFSYGISKAKIKAELPGQRAATRSPEQKPEFYMYFPPTGNLGAADTISSPSQFSLISLEVKKDHRETAVAKIGFGSASAGNDEKKIFKFNAEKIRPYAYRITPDASLSAGEYAFLAATGMGGAASAGSVVIFDFGVDLK